MNTKNTIIEALLKQYPTASKTSIRQWVKYGRVTVNGTLATRADAPVSPKDTVELVGKKPKWEGNIPILYEDNSFVVVNKPSGILSVASNFEKEETIHNILKERYPRKRVYVIHRLDYETSGVMMFALTETAYTFLKKELAARKIKRIYDGIVEGRLEGSGTWECYLKEDANYYVYPTEDATGAEYAVTHYQVLKANDSYSHVRFTLETGKKNQIRVHTAKAGHPITGDIKYGATEDPCGRIALHAYMLQCTHPVTQKALSFVAPTPFSLPQHKKSNS